MTCRDILATIKKEKEIKIVVIHPPFLFNLLAKKNRDPAKSTAGKAFRAC